MNWLELKVNSSGWLQVLSQVIVMAQTVPTSACASCPLQEQEQEQQQHKALAKHIRIKTPPFSLVLSTWVMSQAMKSRSHEQGRENTMLTFTACGDRLLDRQGVSAHIAIRQMPTLFELSCNMVDCLELLCLSHDL